MFTTPPVSPLEAPLVQLPPTPAVERFIAAALTSVGVVEQGGDNRGQMVELYLDEVGLPPGLPWCAAFVHHVGWWSQYNPATGLSIWPLPQTGSCAVLGDVAATLGVLRTVPTRGSVFLMYMSTLGRFAHTGIIVSVDERQDSFTCMTVEGNTSDDGSREGTKSCIRTRRFAKGGRHRFIAWWEAPRS